MDNRDYKADPLYQQRKRDNTAIWLGVVAIAIIAAFVFYGVTQRTAEQAPGDISTQAMSSSGQTAEDGAMTETPANIEPAEGDSFTNQVAPDTATGSAMPSPSMDTPTEAPAASVAPGAVPPSYASEADCKAATSSPCHYVTCDSVPEGKQPDEACGPDFKKGWQPITAATDKTTVPEEINPPLTGQDASPAVPSPAPAANPPLTGQGQ